MTLTATQVARVVRFLRGVAHPRRVRSVVRYLRSLISLPPAAKLDRIFARKGLALPGQVKRLDRRGRAAKVIAQRQKLVTAMLKGEAAEC